MDTASPTFCVLPWIHLATNASGQLRLCCNTQYGHGFIRDPNGKPYSLDSGLALEEIWNSESYRGVRKQMLKGEWPQACNRCKQEEASGVKSSRQIWNENYLNAVTETNPDGRAPLNIRYLDLRLGNFCNLKCRMCNPYASRKWLEDWDRVYPPLESSETKRLSKLDWFENPKVWELLQDVIPSCDQIYFTGGEPMLVKEHQRFLEVCSSHKQVGNLTLKYNTNLTYLPKDLMELWAPFKKVRLNCSLDGIGSLNEYIRHPTDWDQILENLNRLEEMADKNSNMHLSIHITVQSYNFLKITEIFDFTRNLRNFKALPYLNILENPAHLNIRNLPRELKELGIERIEDWLNDNRDFLNDLDPVNVDKIRSLKDYVLGTESKAEYFTKFLDFTQALDLSRKENLRNLVPEFALFQ